MTLTLAPKMAKGKLGIVFLKRFWSNIMLNRNGIRPKEITSEDKLLINPLLNVLGVGLEPTMKYLYGQTPSFEEFENWINENGVLSEIMIQTFNALMGENNGHTPYLKKETPVLNAEEVKHFETEGYVILREAISLEDCLATRKLIYDFLGIDENRPDSWYKDHPAKQGIMIQLFQHPQLQQNRLSSKIRSAYQQLWGRTDLMVSMDRVSLNPPETQQYQFPGPNLHWDVSLKQPIPFGLQGLLYLTDTAANQGAFTLVPSFQHRIPEWLAELPAKANPREQDLLSLGAKPIVANAGDFIIWHQALPHGSAPNTAKSPRMVQYINYQPLLLEMHEEWI